MSDFTFLGVEQVFGDKQLDILKKYGTSAAISDYAILLGSNPLEYYTNEGNTLKDRTGWWWTKSSEVHSNVLCVSRSGNRTSCYVNLRVIGARPALSYSSIQSISTNKVRNSMGILEVEYGEYPQTIVDENYSSELEREFNNKSLKTTGKTYTSDSVRYEDIDKSFRARTHTEYEYNGKKYIRFIGDLNIVEKVLSDGRTIKYGNPYWIHVEPITWLVDEEYDIALSKKIIFFGVQFKNRRDYNGDFDKTDIKQFMDKYFSKEIMPNKVYSQTTSVGQTQNIKKTNRNPYKFDFEEVSEEEIIKGAIESNISVFLHGKSSEGKSARVKQIDKDCVIIYLRNASPESLNGKSVYNQKTGENVKKKKINTIYYFLMK